MGKELFVGERKWETIDCSSVHSGKILVEWY